MSVKGRSGRASYLRDKDKRLASEIGRRLFRLTLPVARARPGLCAREARASRKRLMIAT